MAEFISKDLGVPMDTADLYVDAMFAWAMDGNWDIRAYQQGKGTSDGLTSKEAKKYAEGLESFISSSPRWNGGVTYRGVNISDVSEYKPGKIIDQKGLSSWSSSLDVAKGFTLPTGGKRGASAQKVIFVSPTQNKGTSINHLSPFGQSGQILPPQDEVLVSSSASYAVGKTQRKDGYLFVYLEET
jgi:hypothetical protein